jgi:hypothetical protein
MNGELMPLVDVDLGEPVGEPVGVPVGERIIVTIDVAVSIAIERGRDEDEPRVRLLRARTEPRS